MIKKDPHSVYLIDGTSVTPHTIYGIGRNYAEHARELGNHIPSEPIVFLKHRASLRGLHDSPMAYDQEVFHHEAELVLMIGQNLPLHGQASWTDVSALGLGLDLTRREAQAALKAQGLPWTKAKCFLGAAPVSPFIPLNKFQNPDEITFTLRVSNELRQTGHTKDMLTPVLHILNHLLSFTPLFPGDLIFTGTPPGVGPIRKGEHFVLAFPALAMEFPGVL
jgi:acylpyruvate hydrolase